MRASDDASDDNTKPFPQMFHADMLCAALAANVGAHQEKTTKDIMNYEEKRVAWMRAYVAAEASSSTLPAGGTSFVPWVVLLLRYRRQYFESALDRFHLLHFFISQTKGEEEAQKQQQQQDDDPWKEEEDEVDLFATITEDAFIDLVDDLQPAYLQELLREWCQQRLKEGTSAQEMCETMCAVMSARRATSTTTGLLRRRTAFTILEFLLENQGVAVQTDMCRTALTNMDAEMLALFLRLGAPTTALVRSVVAEPAYRAQVANMAAVVEVLGRHQLLPTVVVPVVEDDDEDDAEEEYTESADL